MPISWLLSLFKGAEDKGPVGQLYETLVQQARTPYFYEELGVEDSLDGRFDMIALHYFLVMHRLRQDQKLLTLSQRLANLIISDMDRSLREMGVGDLGVGKRVQNMGKALYGRMQAYDLALIPALEGQVEEFEQAVSRNIFRDEEQNLESVKYLVQYVLRQQKFLAHLSNDDLEQGIIEFDLVL